MSRQALDTRISNEDEGGVCFFSFLLVFSSFFWLMLPRRTSLRATSGEHIIILVRIVTDDLVYHFRGIEVGPARLPGRQVVVVVAHLRRPGRAQPAPGVQRLARPRPRRHNRRVRLCLRPVRLHEPQVPRARGAAEGVARHLQRARRTQGRCVAARGRRVVGLTGPAAAPPSPAQRRVRRRRRRLRGRRRRRRRRGLRLRRRKHLVHGCPLAPGRGTRRRRRKGGGGDAGRRRRRRRCRRSGGVGGRGRGRERRRHGRRRRRNGRTCFRRRRRRRLCRRDGGRGFGGRRRLLLARGGDAATAAVGGVLLGRSCCCCAERGRLRCGGRQLLHKGCGRKRRGGVVGVLVRRLLVVRCGHLGGCGVRGGGGDGGGGGGGGRRRSRRRAGAGGRVGCGGGGSGGGGCGGGGACGVARRQDVQALGLADAVLDEVGDAGVEAACLPLDVADVAEVLVEIQVEAFLLGGGLDVLVQDLVETGEELLLAV
eukprot:Rhum_TRINITY_DN14299_c7_g1::Rhum_TRINITY_DN14299_c7_g1_i1::g.78348::m.78348